MSGSEWKPTPTATAHAAVRASDASSSSVSAPSGGWPGKQKENKDGFNEILDNLKEVDVAHYINQAKRIDWQSLLDSAEEIMGFVKARNDGTLSVPKPSVSSVSMPKISNDVFDEEDEDDESFFRGGLTLSPPPKNLNLRPPRKSN